MTTKEYQNLKKKSQYLKNPKIPPPLNGNLHYLHFSNKTLQDKSINISRDNFL